MRLIAISFVLCIALAFNMHGLLHMQSELGERPISVIIGISGPEIQDFDIFWVKSDSDSPFNEVAELIFFGHTKEDEEEFKKKLPSLKRSFDDGRHLSLFEIEGLLSSLGLNERSLQHSSNHSIISSDRLYLMFEVFRI